MQPNEYQCAMCGNVYTKATSDEDAMAETHAHWPDVTQQDCAVVCDDCYQQVRPDAHLQEYQESLLAHTDDVVYEILPVGEILRRMIAASGIPPEALGEPRNKSNVKELLSRPLNERLNVVISKRGKR